MGSHVNQVEEELKLKVREAGKSVTSIFRENTDEVLEDSTMIIRESNLAAGSINVISRLWKMVMSMMTEMVR